MAHLSDQYVQATTELLLAGSPVADVLAGLRTTLEDHKHTALWPTVLTQLLRELPTRLRQEIPEVRVASAADLEKHKAYIDSELANLGAPPDYNVIYDDTLIGGTVIQYRSTRIDTSYKHTLKNLYTHIITS